MFYVTLTPWSTWLLFMFYNQIPARHLKEKNGCAMLVQAFFLLASYNPCVIRNFALDRLLFNLLNILLHDVIPVEVISTWKRSIGIVRFHFQKLLSYLLSLAFARETRRLHGQEREVFTQSIAWGSRRRIWRRRL